MLENARCNHYPNRGTCEDRGFITKWYYDRYAHRCREFHYGGCEGNDNRFDSFEGVVSKCNRACKYESLDDPKKRCVLPHDPGSCAGNFERWYFDMRTRQCVCSWWSGCGGNSNMFYSYMHCMSICGIFADNRTSDTKMTFRRCVYEPKRNQHNKTMSPREGRQYRDLFAKRSRLQYSGRLPGKRLRPMSVQNGQHRDGQLARRYHYLVHYSPSQQWKVFSNHFKQDPRQEYSIGMISHKRDHLSPASERVPMLHERQGRIGISETEYYGHSEQSRGQTSYSRAQEVSQSTPYDSPIYSTAPSPEDLHAKDIEAYVQQLQTHERARAQALRERDRIMQQRRDEYERAMMIYKQELQQYQQAVQSAQNRVPKERVDDTNQHQISLQGQYLNLDQTNAFSNGSSLANVQTSEEVRREKLKHRKLLNFEKLKRLEKDRKILKTTSKSLQQMQQQRVIPDQKRQFKNNDFYIRRNNRKEIHQQPTQLHQTSSNSHRAEDQDQQISGEPSKRISLSDKYQDHFEKSIQSGKFQMIAYTESNHIALPNFETERESQRSGRLDRSIANQSVSEGYWHNNQVQPDTEHFPFGMIIAADRLPDDQDVRVAETISASPLPSKNFAQEKQTIAIEDYNDDENYAYDQQTEDDDQLSALLEHIPVADAEGRWALSIAAQPTSAESSTNLSTDGQKMETINAISTTVMKSDMVPAVVEITPFQEDIRADEDHNVKILKDENQFGGNENEKTMFWQGQT
ncbi:Tissue factor pathway inhibitor [Dirofilaria immitis]|nr:Tissue factor pathway inhibitor [Dirofilaria immitis]